MRRTLLAGLVYVLAGIAFTWPLALHLQSLFGVIDPTGDPSLNLWTLGWDLKTLSAHPTWLLTGRIFDANIFFPAGRTLAFSDHLLPQAIALWPLYAVSQDLVFCYNVLLIASLVASALAMHLLARAVVGSEGAAYVAGLVFGFAPYHFTHLTHIQLQALYFLPLSLLFLHHLFARVRRSDIVGLGVVMGLQAVSSAYYGVIGGIGVLSAAAALAILTRRVRDWHLWSRGLAAAAIAVVVALPWSIPYLRVDREMGAGRNLFEASHNSAVLASYVQAPRQNLVYGRTGWLRTGPDVDPTREEAGEQALFPGFCALLLALAGMLAAPRAMKTTVAVYGFVAVVGVVLSLGPDGIRPLYSALYQSLFGMQIIRAPARFSVLALCSIAMLSAIAVRALEVRSARAQPVLLSAVLAIIALEYSNGAIAFPPAPTLSSNAGRWLREQPGPGAVVCLPMGFEAGNTKCMLQSLEHGRSIVNGYSGLRPPFFAALVDAMSRMPSADALLTLHDVNVEYIVSDRPLDIDPTLRQALVERARFDDQSIYQLVWSSAIETAMTTGSDPVPPEPGPLPFAAGESATYRVLWTSGPVSAPAGDATISVGAPREGEAFRLIVSAKTAPWVSRFANVDAMLETTANQRLLPLVHVETINEGKRRTDRRLEFDSVAREVRMTNGDSSITLSLAAEARNATTALFYVRTLPFQTGADFALPLSDNGRRSRLEVKVAGLETIMLDGRAQSAWKLEVRLRERVERRTPLAITAWISEDARRIPLVIEVAAFFGAARIELTKYQDR